MENQLRIIDLPAYAGLVDFELYNLAVHSQALKKNPLGDSPIKNNFVLAPKGEKPYPVIFHLSGYFGNGEHNFNTKTLEENFAQKIIEMTSKKKIPLAHHVFVDAMTSVGGSQFINSLGCGRYGEYIQKELVDAVKRNFSTVLDQWALLGSSSGGYGALYHISQKQSPFSCAIAVAPDSHFESSLLPELYKVAPYLDEYKHISRIKKALSNGELKKQKHFFDIMNVLAMGLCYGKVSKSEISFPIDLSTGEVINKHWKYWKQSDPINFLSKNAKNLKDKHIFLDVGLYDNFNLQFGTRQVRNILKKYKLPHTYSEFEGNHFGLSARKELALQWLKRRWK